MASIDDDAMAIDGQAAFVVRILYRTPMDFDASPAGVVELPTMRYPPSNVVSRPSATADTMNRGSLR